MFHSLAVKPLKTKKTVLHMDQKPVLPPAPPPLRPCSVSLMCPKSRLNQLNQCLHPQWELHSLYSEPKHPILPLIQAVVLPSLPT